MGVLSINELRALACLVKHKAHVVKWAGTWAVSRCIWCWGTSDDFEELSSFPFIHVDDLKDDVCVFQGKRQKPLNGQPYFLEIKTHRYLKRFGLTWPQVRGHK